MWHFRTWFSRHSGVGLTAGLADLRDLFQPIMILWFYSLSWSIQCLAASPIFLINQPIVLTTFQHFLCWLVKHQIPGAPKPWQCLQVTYKGSTAHSDWWCPAAWQHCWFTSCSSRNCWADHWEGTPQLAAVLRCNATSCVCMRFKNATNFI